MTTDTSDYNNKNGFYFYNLKNVLISDKSDDCYSCSDVSGNTYAFDITLKDIKLFYYGKIIDINRTYRMQTPTTGTYVIYVGMQIEETDYMSDNDTGYTILETSGEDLVISPSNWIIGCERTATNNENKPIILPDDELMYNRVVFKQPLIRISVTNNTSGSTINSISWVNDNNLPTLDYTNYYDYVNGIYRLVEENLGDTINSKIDNINSEITEKINELNEIVGKSNSSGGFTGGSSTSATTGGAVGWNATATGGGAVGTSAKETGGGFAGGNGASATTGGAVGWNAISGAGFAGGHNAKTQDSSGDRIDAIQLGTGTNYTARTLQVYDYQLMDADGNIPSERLKTSNGGFAAGNGASATSGGAVGSNASATSGGAVGHNASATSGGAVGKGAEEIGGGFAGGINASATLGGAVGYNASATIGGGAVGSNAKTSAGFAGGSNAKTQDSSGDGIDAIQLGRGTNSTEKTLQVYEYQLMDADGNIPSERLKTSDGGFAAAGGSLLEPSRDNQHGVAIGKDSTATAGAAIGPYAFATYGGAVGYETSTYNGCAVGGNAEAIAGAAVGSNTKTSNGFAGGFNAKTIDAEDNGIDAIQLGTGTNQTAKTLQVYNYQLMDASGNVPSARLTQAVNSMGSDFAESLEWLDGNPNNEDRRGLFVALTSDENNEYNKIKLANSDDEIVGVVSSIPTVVGNSCNDNWKGKYQTDIFGKPLTQIVHHEAVYEDVEVRDKDEDGNLLKTTHTESVLVSEAYDTEEYILSSEYDPSQEYIPRLKRKEWASIGFIGQLIVVDDGTCIPGKKCKCGNNGVGTLSDNDIGYRVLSRIDNTHIKILLK